MKGFTFFLPSKQIDYFVETEQQRKTDFFAGKIIHKFGWIDTPGNREYLVSALQKAECDIKTLPNGKQYYDIHGENFGGKGSFIGDGHTVIIKL